MTRVDLREVGAALLPGVLLAAWLLGAAAILAATLESAERAALVALLEPRLALVAMAWLVVSGVLGYLLRAAWLRWAGAPARLAEQATIALATDLQREIEPIGSAGTRALAKALNALARQRGELRADIDRKAQLTTL